MDLKKLFKLSKMLLKLSEVETDKGILVSDEELAVGIAVFIDKEGELVPAEDGEYIADEKIIVVKDGAVAEIKEKEEITEEVIEEELEEEVAPEKDEKDLKIEELEGLLKEKDAVIEDLNGKIKELEDKLKEPTEEPVALSKTPTFDEKTIKNNPVLRYFNK